MDGKREGHKHLGVWMVLHGRKVGLLCVRICIRVWYVSIYIYLLGGDRRSGGSQKGGAEEREGKEGEGTLEHHGLLCVWIVVVVVVPVLLCVDVCVCMYE